MYSKVIVHCYLPCFYTQVEESLFPYLKNKAFLIKKDNTILEMNKKAKSIIGKKSIDLTNINYPNIIVIDSHDDEYRYLFEAIVNIFKEYSDNVTFNNKEIWADFTCNQWIMNGTKLKMIDDLYNRIYKELGIYVSLGVSDTYLFAKAIHSQIKGVYTLFNYKNKNLNFLFPEMPYLNKDSIDILNNHNIVTISDAFALSLEQFKDLIGYSGFVLWDLFHGEKDREDSYFKFDSQINNFIVPIRDCLFLNKKNLFKNVVNKMNMFNYDIKHCIIYMYDSNQRVSCVEMALICSSHNKDVLYDYFECYCLENHIDLKSINNICVIVDKWEECKNVNYHYNLFDIMKNVFKTFFTPLHIHKKVINS